MKKTKLKGLGRGLDALLSDETLTFDDVPASALKEVRLSELHPGRYQPRHQMDEAALSELAESIREQGLISPIVVREDSWEGGYEIIAGERRFRALMKLGHETATVLIRDFDDKKTLAVALIENLQREDLNPIDEAMGIARLIEEFGYTHEAAATAIGRSRTATTNALRLLDLTPEVKTMVVENLLTMGHARALLGLKGAEQVAAAKEVALKGLSVRQTEELVKRLVKGGTQGVRREERSRDAIRLEETLSDTLGAVVKLSANKKGKGRLVIEFSSLDQLEGIVGHIQK